MDAETVKISKEEGAQEIHYAHRWLVQKQNLPSPIRSKVIRWIRENEVEGIRRFWEPLAKAFEENNRSYLEIEI